MAIERRENDRNRFVIPEDLSLLPDEERLAYTSAENPDKGYDAALMIAARKAFEQQGGISSDSNLMDEALVIDVKESINVGNGDMLRELACAKAFAARSGPEGRAFANQVFESEGFKRLLKESHEYAVQSAVLVRAAHMVDSQKHQLNFREAHLNDADMTPMSHATYIIGSVMGRMSPENYSVLDFMERLYNEVEGLPPLPVTKDGKYKAVDVNAPPVMVGDHIPIHFTKFEDVARLATYTTNTKAADLPYDQAPTDLDDMPARRREVIVERYAADPAIEFMRNYYNVNQYGKRVDARFPAVDSMAQVISIDGVPLSEVKENMEKEGKAVNFGTVLGAALLAGKHVEAFIPGMNGQMSKEPTTLTAEGSPPKTLRRETMNAFQRFFAHLGINRSKLERIRTYDRIMENRTRTQMLYATDGGLDEKERTAIGENKERYENSKDPKEMAKMIFGDKFPKDIEPTTEMMSFVMASMANRAMSLEEMMDPNEGGWKKMSFLNEYQGSKAMADKGNVQVANRIDSTLTRGASSMMQLMNKVNEKEGLANLTPASTTLANCAILSSAIQGCMPSVSKPGGQEFLASLPHIESRMRMSELQETLTGVPISKEDVLKDATNSLKYSANSTHEYLNREMTSGAQLRLEDPKKISIKLLQDAMTNRLTAKGLESGVSFTNQFTPQLKAAVTATVRGPLAESLINGSKSFETKEKFRDMIQCGNVARAVEFKRNDKGEIQVKTPHLDTMNERMANERKQIQAERQKNAAAPKEHSRAK